MRNMRRNIRIGFVVLLMLFILLGGYLSYIMFVYGDRWFSNSYNPRVRLDTREPKVIPGDIIDRNGVVLATTKEEVVKDPVTGKNSVYYLRSYCGGSKYAKSSAHVVGFHHPQLGRIGAEAFHIRYLMGYNNSLIELIYQKAFLPYEKGNHIVLTIDFELQRYIDYLMGDLKGSVVLINPRNGEILAMVSHPTFDPNNLDKNIEGDALFNRATEGLYPPGSIFKIVTAISAFENIEGVLSRTFKCTGGFSIQNSYIPCYGGQEHGEVSIGEAMAYSCNYVFAKLGIELGREKLLKTGEAFGFNQDFLFSDLKVVSSVLPLRSEVSKQELAWSSIGQANVLVTPLHMAMVVSSIANDGIMMEPRILYRVMGRNKRIVEEPKPKVFRNPLSKENARIMASMLEKVVYEGTGKRAFVEGVKVAGKTGTAEKTVGSNTRRNYAWFIGYVSCDQPTLAIAVVLEDLEEKETGGTKAAPLAGKILKKALELGY